MISSCTCGREAMDIVDLIQRKRDGKELTSDEIGSFLDAYMGGEVAEYQMSAWLMAAFLKGLTLGETRSLMDAMIASGETLDLSPLGRTVVDKHSTGGVGDKVSLVLGPLVASCGAVFGKMSGRGLGHTGGTVDKLESIPGFRTTLDSGAFISQLQEVALCIAGQSPELVPADDRLYALRDVTATVDSNPLTAASIMSKKVAAGADVVALDVKVGSGAFFRNRGQAAGVAHLMQQLGEARGMQVVILMTSMEQPLGHAVGNAVEVREAIETLGGNGPGDLVELVTALAAELLSRAGLGLDREQAAQKAAACLESGAALEKMEQWIAAQGGDPACVREPEVLALAPVERTLKATTDGFVSSLDALTVGQAVFALGAGRRRRGDPVDHGVGAVVQAKVGDGVAAGQELATVYARSGAAADVAIAALGAAYSFSEERVEPPPVAETGPIC